LQLGDFQKKIYRKSIRSFQLLPCACEPLIGIFIGFKKIILGFHAGWGERSEPQLNQDVGVHSVHPNLPKIIILKAIKKITIGICHEY